MQALMSIQYYDEPENILTEIIQDEDKDIFDFKYYYSSTKKITCYSAYAQTNQLVCNTNNKCLFLHHKLLAQIIFRAILNLAHPALREF